MMARRLPNARDRFFGSFERLTNITVGGTDLSDMNIFTATSHGFSVVISNDPNHGDGSFTLSIRRTDKPGFDLVNEFERHATLDAAKAAAWDHVQAFRKGAPQVFTPSRARPSPFGPPGQGVEVEASYTVHPPTEPEEP